MVDKWEILGEPRATPGAARLVCVANQKGGVAKTTTVVNLGAALALAGHRILIVDVDPQANATTAVGIDHRTVVRSSYDLLAGDAAFNDVVTPTSVAGLDCVPATLDLAGAEIELVSSGAREEKLGDALRDHVGGYALVFLDCPPSLGLLTINALAAATDLVVPVQCEYYALEGLGQLLGTTERVRRSLNPDLRITGFVLTMYDARTKLSGQVAAEVRTHFGDVVFATVIPRSVRLSEAPSFGEPVLTLDPSARGSIAYRLLAAEVEARYGLEASPQPSPPASTAAVVAGTPGRFGRGYGVEAPEPPGLEDAWPPQPPWGHG